MKRASALVLALALALSGLGAEGLTVSVKGVAFNFAILPPLPLPTGGDLQLGLPVASLGGQPLAAVLRLRGAYEDLYVLRDPSSGDPVAFPASLDNAYYRMSPNFQWALGLVQGLVAGEKDNLLEAFLLYRGRYDVYETSLATTTFSDNKGLFGTSVLLGLGYNGDRTDSRRVKRGSFAEASLEVGPSWLNDGTDFWRVNAQGQAYYPLLSSGQAANAKLNRLSVYLAGKASVDYAGGSEVPLWVMQSFGGRDLDGSLGSEVRGYPTSSYDSSFKALANGEIRLLGPALFGQAWCVPMVYLFCDAGYYANFSRSATYGHARGTLTSAGAGFNLDVFDFAYIGLYAGLKFPGDDDALYTVYDQTDPFFWKVGFLLHF